ncbi:acetyl-CoA carboxylase, biotin carboxyl carrier protein, partial [Clostridium saudiense]|nr:acetyl-CoA carboxylase, biotin carboxyl carrier protein [Clostridium saudiense]
LVGTFYSSSTPGGKPYVEVGSKVKKGDVLCIVEAMKIMNEITSDFDGEIVEILRKDEDIVEFGMTIFKIK